ncbi:TatD family hydrolase [Ketobacter sp.]|uniref:TatD family hydrolase n=1 Tax=Ketobacter sp. TaxID=2083498 RepID=UPI000F11ECC0|nr:TatD family hydrolase [Ketobacter sp.]RLT97991.1 MAG: TatD family deoxyribonuclease [Ketobacter sp.]
MHGLIDSHCHVDFPQFDASRDEVLRACHQNGMSAILVPGVTLAQWPRLSEVIHAYPDVTHYPRLLPAYGLHPCFMADHAAESTAGLMARLDAQLAEEAGCVVAVGEIGLDSFHSTADLKQQVTLFEAQLRIAGSHGLPVIIHSRKTQDLVLKSVRKQRFSFGGILHAFSGSLQQAQQAVDLGFKIGFGGAATYERASRLRGMLKALPREAIVFETDAPDIPPSFARDRPNSPFNLFRIVEILAQVRQESVADLLEYSSKNLIGVLNLAD